MSEFRIWDLVLTLTPGHQTWSPSPSDAAPVVTQPAQVSLYADSASLRSCWCLSPRPAVTQLSRSCHKLSRVHLIVSVRAIRHTTVLAAVPLIFAGLAWWPTIYERSWLHCGIQLPWYLPDCWTKTWLDLSIKLRVLETSHFRQASRNRRTHFVFHSSEVMRSSLVCVPSVPCDGEIGLVSLWVVNKGSNTLLKMLSLFFLCL